MGLPTTRARNDARLNPRAAGAPLLIAASIVALGCVRPAAAQTNGAVVDALRDAATTNKIATRGSYVDLNAGAYWTDNARRSEFNTVSDTVTTVGTSLNTAYKSTVLQYAASGDINYLKYVDNTFKPETFGQLDGSLQVAVLPERFDWVFRDSFNRLLLDPTQAATPSNLEAYNYFTTGPRLLLRFSSSLQLILQAEYSRVNSFNSSNLGVTEVSLDSKRYTGRATLVYAESRHGKLSVNVSTQRVRPDNTALISDYNRTEASLGYNGKVARTTFGVEIGGTRLEQGGASSSGLLARLGASRNISPSSSVSLSLVRQTADSADIIRGDFSQVSSNESPRLAAADPLADTTVTLGWQFQKPRTLLGVDLYRTRERYTVSKSLDRDISGIGASFERRMRPTMALQLSGHYEYQSFELTHVTDREIDVSAALNWYAGRRLKVSFQADHSYRRSPSQVLMYTENRIGVQVGYNLLRARR